MNSGSLVAPDGFRPMPITLSFDVLPYQVDAYGVVSNITYITWLEAMRVKLLNTYYSLKTSAAAGLMPVLARTDINYLRPARFEDAVRAEMWIGQVMQGRIDYCGEFYVDDVRISKAVQHGYYVDNESLRPVRVPDAFRSKFNDDCQQLTN